MLVALDEQHAFFSLLLTKEEATNADDNLDIEVTDFNGPLVQSSPDHNTLVLN